jgi:hypothetical protein
MTGKGPGPTRDRNGPNMETYVALMRSVHLSAYRIALTLKVRRQRVDDILRRPHIAAMVEDFRTRLRADQLLQVWASKAWWGEF